jgi:hypothetical protein
VSAEIKETCREMRRNFLSSIRLSTIVAAALLPAGSLWAAPNAGTSAHYLTQIDQQTYQIQTQADRLEVYVRSGADEWTVNAGFAADMADGAQKLLALLDQVAAQPRATNDTRMQVEKMKVMTAEVMAFTGNAYRDLEARALPLHARDVLANTANIEALCNTIRGAAQTLATAR